MNEYIEWCLSVINDENNWRIIKNPLSIGIFIELDGENYWRHISLYHNELDLDISNLITIYKSEFYGSLIKDGNLLNLYKRVNRDRKINDILNG